MDWQKKQNKTKQKKVVVPEFNPKSAIREGRSVDQDKQVRNWLILAPMLSAPRPTAVNNKVIRLPDEIGQLGTTKISISQPRPKPGFFGQ